MAVRLGIAFAIMVLDHIILRHADDTCIFTIPYYLARGSHVPH